MPASRRVALVSWGGMDPELIEHYSMWLSVSGCSSRTVNDRVAAVRRLGRYAGADPRHVTATQITTWIGAVTANWSRATYYNHAVSWFRYLVKTGERTDNPMESVPKPRARRGTPRPIATPGLQAALDHAEPTTKTMLLLAAYAGMRVSEIARMHGEDVTADTIYIEGKGGSRMMVPTHPAIWAEVGCYPRRGPWFPGGVDGCVCRQTVWRRMVKALRDVDVTATPHQLRHWYGTEALRQSRNLRVTQELLRHSSPTTTAIYTLVTDDERRAAVTALPTLVA